MTKWFIAISLFLPLMAGATETTYSTKEIKGLPSEILLQLDIIQSIQRETPSFIVLHEDSFFEIGLEGGEILNEVTVKSLLTSLESDDEFLGSDLKFSTVSFLPKEELFVTCLTGFRADESFIKRSFAISKDFGTVFPLYDPTLDDPLDVYFDQAHGTKNFSVVTDLQIGDDIETATLRRISLTPYLDGLRVVYRGSSLHSQENARYSDRSYFRSFYAAEDQSGQLHSTTELSDYLKTTQKGMNQWDLVTTGIHYLPSWERKTANDFKRSKSENFRLWYYSYTKAAGVVSAGKFVVLALQDPVEDIDTKNKDTSPFKTTIFQFDTETGKFHQRSIEGYQYLVGGGKEAFYLLEWIRQKGKTRSLLIHKMVAGPE